MSGAYKTPSMSDELFEQECPLGFSEGRIFNEMYENYTNTTTSVTDNFAPQNFKNAYLNLFHT